MATSPPPPSLSDQPPAVRPADWQTFADELAWAQGEHVTLIGPTGTGKTELATRLLLPRRDFVLVLCVKRRDSVLAKLRDQGYLLMRDWKDVPASVAPRIVLAPPAEQGLRSLGHQRDVFRRALEAVYRQGGWTVYADELRYVTDFLGLRQDMELLWHQGRSEGITVIGATQRPRHVPLMAYNSATHLFFYRDGDRSNLQRIAELGGGIDHRQIMETVANLPRTKVPFGRPSDVLYVNTLHDELVQIDHQTVPVEG